MIERVPDPATLDWDALWEETWQAQLLAAALANIRRHLDPRKYQIFDLYVHHEWPAEQVAATFSVSTDQVYLTKHRITESLKDEIKRLETKII